MMNPEAAATMMSGDRRDEDGDHRRSDATKGDVTTSSEGQSQAWGTWEELLLACAVKRHGFRNWDSVAMELRAKSSLPRLLTTAHNCRLKYRDLERRFTAAESGGGGRGDEGSGEDEPEGDKKDEEGGEVEVDSIPWLEQLRSLRVAELRRELQRSDVSISSLQLKVKRLEEEREREQAEQNPDLGEDSKGQGSEDDKSEPNQSKPEESPREEESDRENRSVNESNSTGSGDKPDVRGAGAAQVRDAPDDPDPVRKSEVSHSGELGESETHVSGDVQSSASLGRKRKRWRGGRRKEEKDGGDGIKAVAMKSQPLFGVLKAIRAHPHVSFFDRRLLSQESDDYKGLIKQHLDLETIQSKLDKGSYASCNPAFFRDLLLLFNNAILFFPKASPESRAAIELRTVVSTHRSRNPDHRDPPPAGLESDAGRLQPESEVGGATDSVLAKHRRSPTLIVCRKRSSLSGKRSSNLAFGRKAEQQQSEGKKPENENQKLQGSEEAPAKKEEKPVTGTRSSRRSNKRVNLDKSPNNNTSTTPNNKKQSPSSGSKAVQNDKQEAPKPEKKKPEGLISDKKKSVADFLRRIKTNSPKREEPKKNRNSNGGVKDGGKHRVLRSHREKKKAEGESNPSKRASRKAQQKKRVEKPQASRKRGRESSGGKETPQKKRARR